MIAFPNKRSFVGSSNLFMSIFCVCRTLVYRNRISRTESIMHLVFIVCVKSIRKVSYSFFSVSFCFCFSGLVGLKLWLSFVEALYARRACDWLKSKLSNLGKYLFGGRFDHFQVKAGLSNHDIVVSIIISDSLLYIDCSKSHEAY